MLTPDSATLAGDEQFPISGSALVSFSQSGFTHLGQNAKRMADDWI